MAFELKQFSLKLGKQKSELSDNNEKILESKCHQKYFFSRLCFCDMTSQCDETQGVNSFDPVIDPDGFI